MDRLIHTPEGVRDVYNQECTKKLYLENQIEQVFHAFDIRILKHRRSEFFDVFGREVGTTPSRALQILLTATATPLCSVGLYPVDCTRSLHVFHGRDDADPPLLQRSSFVNSSSYQGRLKSTQMVSSS